MKTNSITQEYLENLRRDYSEVNKLVENVLERTVQSAKEGSYASITCIHKDEYSRDVMRKAYQKLRERKFLVVVDEFKEEFTDGYIGEIKIYLDSSALLKGNKLTEDNFDLFLSKLQELNSQNKLI